jgi:hypothetical protein
MIIETNLKKKSVDYTVLINNKINKKVNSLQFLPSCLDHLKDQKYIYFGGEKLKTSYIIDLVHGLILKFYLKKENLFYLHSLVLKDKYGYLYGSYIKYLLDKNIIRLVRNYKAGFRSKSYSLNTNIFKSKIQRYNNSDKILLKKFKKKIVDSVDLGKEINSPIDIDVRKKLVSDLFTITIDKERSMHFLNNLKVKDFDVYNRNSYSVESISNKHIFFHFDTYGRMHTNFTILRSFIRKNCLLIDGEVTAEIDIKNSQPFFLCKLIQDVQSNWVNKEEFEFFKKLIINGTFYEFIMNSIHTKDRKFVKELTYKVLFGRNSPNSKADKIFSELFPTIWKFIKLYKKDLGDYKALSYELQRSESNFIFNRVIKRIMMEYPHIKMITVHDSIVFPINYINEVSEIFEQEKNIEFSLI